MRRINGGILGVGFVIGLTVILVNGGTVVLETVVIVAAVVEVEPTQLYITGDVHFAINGLNTDVVGHLN